MSRAIIHNSDYGSLNAAKEAIDLYFAREMSISLGTRNGQGTRSQDLGKRARSKPFPGGAKLQESCISVVDLFVSWGLS